MNSVERVKAICKERKLAISKLEKDLGFSNGYIGQLRKGTFPAERLAAIAEYLGVSTDFLLGKEETTIMDLFTGKSSRPLTPMESAIIDARQKNSPGKPEPTERESKILEAFRTKTPAEQKAFLTLLGISED